MGGSAEAAAGEGAPRRARRVRLRRGGRARLRRRAHRLTRGPDAGDRPRSDRPAAGRDAGGAQTLGGDGGRRPHHGGGVRGPSVRQQWIAMGARRRLLACRAERELDRRLGHRGPQPRPVVPSHAR